MNGESKRPDENVLKQQRLRSVTNLLTLHKVIGFCLFTGVLFIILGGIVRNANLSVVEVEQRYDNDCPQNQICTLNLTIQQEMRQPVYVYYRLENFYQNVRRYVKSVANPQLRGVTIDKSLSNCNPLQSVNGSFAYPCGLVANSFFNDTIFGKYCPGGHSCSNFSSSDWTENDIVWPTDSVKFVQTSHPTTMSPYGFQLPRIDDPHFKTWMRISLLPDFRRLYAIIHKDLHAGDSVQIQVANVFDVKSVSAKKYIIIATTSVFGTRREFLSTAYFVIGVLCVFLSLGAMIKLTKCPRGLGDMRYFYVDKTMDVHGLRKNSNVSITNTTHTEKGTLNQQEPPRESK